MARAIRPGEGSERVSPAGSADSKTTPRSTPTSSSSQPRRRSRFAAADLARGRWRFAFHFSGAIPASVPSARGDGASRIAQYSPGLQVGHGRMAGPFVRSREIRPRRRWPTRSAPDRARAHRSARRAAALNLAAIRRRGVRFTPSMATRAWSDAGSRRRGARRARGAAGHGVGAVAAPFDEAPRVPSHAGRRESPSLERDGRPAGARLGLCPPGARDAAAHAGPRRRAGDCPDPGNFRGRRNVRTGEKWKENRRSSTKGLNRWRNRRHGPDPDAKIGLGIDPPGPTIWCSSITPRCRWRPRSFITVPACAGRRLTSTTSTAGRPPTPGAKWCPWRPRRTGRSSSTSCRSTSG